MFQTKSLTSPGLNGMVAIEIPLEWFSLFHKKVLLSRNFRVSRNSSFWGSERNGIPPKEFFKSTSVFICSWMVRNKITKFRMFFFSMKWFETEFPTFLSSAEWLVSEFRAFSVLQNRRKFDAINQNFRLFSVPRNYSILWQPRKQPLLLELKIHSQKLFQMIKNIPTAFHLPGNAVSLSRSSNSSWFNIFQSGLLNQRQSRM